MNPVDQLETVLTLDQAQQLGEPNSFRTFGEEKSIHQLLDDLLGDLEEDDSLLCLTLNPKPALYAHSDD